MYTIAAVITSRWGVGPLDRNSQLCVGSRWPLAGQSVAHTHSHKYPLHSKSH